MSTVVKISASLSNLNIAAVHYPPHKPISPIQFQPLLTSLGPTFLAGGDWNEKLQQWVVPETTEESLLRSMPSYP